MIEHPKSVVELMGERTHLDVDVQRSFERLGTCVETLFTIDSGDYPFTVYSSGEKRVKRASNGGLVETDEIVSLPIMPKGRERGLRYLVTHVIFDERTYLSDVGLQKEADEIIDLGRLHERKRLAAKF